MNIYFFNYINFPLILIVFIDCSFGVEQIRLPFQLINILLTFTNRLRNILVNNPLLNTTAFPILDKKNIQWPIDSTYATINHQRIFFVNFVVHVFYTRN